MREFFQGWRRKVGAAALLIACSLLAFWMQAMADVRSRTASETLPVVRIIGLWQQGEKFDAQGNRCRGAEGLILFLNKNSQSVRCTGKVLISLFEGTDIDSRPATAAQTFAYDAAAWNRCASFGSFGTQYKVFLPTRVDPATIERCDVRLISDDGAVVRCDMQSWRHPMLARLRSQASIRSGSALGVSPAIALCVVEMQAYVCILIVLLTVLSAYLILIPYRKQRVSQLYD